MDIHPNTIRDLKEVKAGRSPVGSLDVALASTMLALIEEIEALRADLSVHAVHVVSPTPKPNEQEAP